MNDVIRPIGECPMCGVAEGRPALRSARTRLREWLRGGRNPSGAVHLECAGCGHRAVTGVLRARRSGWWSWPVDLLRVVRDERSMEPVPLTYLMAAAMGLVLGVGAQLALGWPWWLVGTGFVAGVWLFFMSTALWGTHHGRREVLRMFAPRRAARRDVRDTARSMTALGRPMCGVDGWPGELGLGGIVGRGPDADGLRLVHGNVRGGPCVEVTIADWLDADSDRARQALADQVAAWASPRRSRPRHGPQPAWTSRRFVIDGAQLAFAFTETGPVWAAVRAVGGDEIRIVARDVPPEQVRLTLVRNLTPYVESELRRIARHRPPRRGRRH